MSETSADPTTTVEAFLKAFIAMDFDTALTHITDDCEYTNVPMGTVRGPAGVREVLEPFFAPIHENDFVILRQSATGPVVFMERQARTHLGTIEYHDVGEGPVIVFLHLILAEASHWDKMPPLLADRFRCIFPTLPMGAHRIPADDNADLSAAGLARAVADLLDHLDVHDVTLVGNDSGGAISQVVAVNHPERLGRVVLTNCDMYDVFPPKMFSYFTLLPYIPGGLSITARALKIHPDLTRTSDRRSSTLRSLTRQKSDSPCG